MSRIRQTYLLATLACLATSTGPGCKEKSGSDVGGSKPGSGAANPINRATGPFTDAQFDALPNAQGDRLWEVHPVHITTKAVILRGRTLLNLAGGHVARRDITVQKRVSHLGGILPMLKKEAQAQTDWRKRKPGLGAGPLVSTNCLLIAAERQVPYRTVDLVLTTASLAGFQCFQAAVRQRAKAASQTKGAPLLQAVGVPFALDPLFRNYLGPMESYVHDGCQRDRSVYTDDPESNDPYKGGIGFHKGRPVPKKPKVFLTRLSAAGGLDAATLMRVIRRHLSEVQYCYVVKGLSSNPKLSGLVKVSFTITPTGSVGQTQLSASTIQHPPTEKCIKAAIRRWRFPKPEGSMPFVTAPFHLKLW